MTGDDLHRLLGAYQSISDAQSEASDTHSEVQTVAAEAGVESTRLGRPLFCAVTHDHECHTKRSRDCSAWSCDCRWAFGLNLDIAVTTRKEAPLGAFRLPDPRYDTWGFSWVGSEYLAGRYPGLVVPEANDSLAAEVYGLYWEERASWARLAVARGAFTALWRELVGTTAP